MVRHLRHFSERRQQAWDRVIELEHRAAPDFERTTKLLQQSLELLAANDAAGARRNREEVEQSNRQQEEAAAEAPRARRRAMLRFELPFAVMGLAVLLAIAALNYLWLGALGVDYLGAYLRDGFQVALLFTVVGVAISLDSRQDLIAAHPTIYVAEVFVLFTSLLASLAALLGSPRSDDALADAGLESLGRRFRPRTADFALSWLFTVFFCAAMLAWAVLIAPLQYWVNLVCGAPAREALVSSKTLWLAERPHQTEFISAPKKLSESQRRDLDEAGEGGKLTEIGFATQPVTFTSAIAAVLLFGISRLV